MHLGFGLTLGERGSRFGFTLPIIVRELGKGKFEIIDGEHRWRAAKELLMPEVRVVNLGVVPDEKAKQLTILLNELGGSPDQVRLADLLRDINATVDFAALSAVMPYSSKELAMFIESVDFSFSKLSDQDTRPTITSLPTAAGDELSEEERIELLPGAGQGDRPEEFTARRVRLTVQFEPAAAKALEEKLARINADPAIAIALAVDAYFAQADLGASDDS